MKMRLLTLAAIGWIAVATVTASRTSFGADPLTSLRADALTSLRAGAPSTERLVQTAQAPSVPVAATASTREYQALLDRYCVTCHNARLNLPAGAPLYLDKVDVADVARDAEVWEKVLRKLGVGAMPPQGSPKPAPAALRAFTSHVTTALDRAADAGNNPGEFVIHRLNRTEYANAIRDILGLDVDVAALLPPDSSDFGFDNIASALAVTPALLERYLTAAARVSALAVGDPAAEPIDAKFPIRLDFTQNGYVEGLPLGTRGGTLIRHTFPADGEYQLSGALFRPIDNADTGIEGHDTPHEFVITVDGAPVHTATFGGPEDHVASVTNLAAAREAVEARMKVRLPITAGPHEIGFTFLDKPSRSQDIFQLPIRSSQDLHQGSELPKLREVAIAGPYNGARVSDFAVRQRLFICRPANASDEARCARQILSTIARRAYRRPVVDADLQPLMSFYERGREGGSFDDGVRSALARVLASPSFLFRTEQNRTNAGAHPVSDVELASRLSFFLWSSIPDDELLNLAVEGRLRVPGVLERQVRRMIADRRADALTSNFTSQWLALRNLAAVAPDLLGFPDWDHNLREGLHRETELFFGSIVRENRSALDLLNADHTFVNERVARHYGIPNVYGPEFRRVPVADPNRRGLLGQASLLTLTSVATRTSPVFRGKYILSTFLNTPPLPPPPDLNNVLPPEAESAAPKSVRERLETHRANPVCSSCHRSMDPIGFALENFDAVGRWRAAEANGTPVDASGLLVDGTPVNGPVALRQWLTAHPDVFVGTLTEKLLIYALGRGLQPYDLPVVRGIVRTAARDDYRFFALINGIVQSRPFQMRITVGPRPAPAGRQASAPPGGTARPASME